MLNPHRLPNRLRRSSGTTKPTSTDEYQCWWAWVGLTGFEPATLCSRASAQLSRTTGPWIRGRPPAPAVPLDGVSAGDGRIRLSLMTLARSGCGVGSHPRECECNPVMTVSDG
jgi:hypothetical protein